jgi:hypothetical protein
MSQFTSAELAGMRAANEAAMMDSCLVLVYSTDATDDYGIPVPTYTAGEPVPCGLDNLAGRGYRSSREVMIDSQVVILDARLRLPVGTTIKAADRVQITHRFGEALANSVTYDVIGDPMRGPSGLQVNLKAVHAGG